MQSILSINEQVVRMLSISLLHIKVAGQICLRRPQEVIFGDLNSIL